MRQKIKIKNKVPQITKVVKKARDLKQNIIIILYIR